MSNTPKQLTIYRHGNINIVDIAEKAPISSKGQIKIDEEFLKGIYGEINRITTLANDIFYRKDSNAGQFVNEELEKIGHILFSHLLPPKVQKYLRKGKCCELYLKLDDKLAYIPWELCFDGEDFLTTKFMIGRQILTDQSIRETRHNRHNQGKLKMIIIIDPTESLKYAQDEAEKLCSILESKGVIEIELIGGRMADKFRLISEMRNKDIIHFIGHAFFDEKNPEKSGWLLKEGILTSLELGRMDNSPLLVFSNACRSGASVNRETGYFYEEKVFGIGNSFLMAGVQNFIGPFWVIHDEGSVKFAYTFYSELVKGESIGKSLLKAKLEALKERGSGDILWASYTHYGDPATKIVTKVEDQAIDSSRKHPLSISSLIPKLPESKLIKICIITGIFIILLLGNLYWFRKYFNKAPHTNINNSILTQAKKNALSKRYEDGYRKYKSGNVQEAQKIFEDLIGETNNQQGLGDVSVKLQKSRAYNALGILSSNNDNIEKAIAYFRQAVSMNPENTDALFNLGYTTWRPGRKDEFRSVLKKVIDIQPEDELAHHYMEIINNAPELNEDEGTANILILFLLFDGGQFLKMGVGEAISWLVGRKLEDENVLNVFRNPALEEETRYLDIGFHKISDFTAAVNIAKVAKADYVFYGSYRIFENILEVDVRVVNVDTTEIITIDNEKTRGKNKINDMAEILVKKITSNIEQ